MWDYIDFLMEGGWEDTPAERERVASELERLGKTANAAARRSYMEPAVSEHEVTIEVVVPF